MDIAKLIDEAHEKSAESPRPYLGGSQIGKNCRRAIWYDFRWANHEKFPGRMLRLFRHGYAYEPLFIKDLRKLGYSVLTKHRKTGRDIGFSDLDGHFKGHVDGIAAKKGEEWMLLEFKTHSDKSFKKLVKQGIVKSKPQHYAQMQVYMRYMKLRKALYMAVNKNDDTLYCDFVDYDKEWAQYFVDRAREVIQSDLPLEPINTNEDSWDCKFCCHKNVCYKRELPLMNCRTCMYSSVASDGMWSCGMHETILTPKDQRKGCERHEFIPALSEDVVEELKKNPSKADAELFAYEAQRKLGAKIITKESVQQ